MKRATTNLQLTVMGAAILVVLGGLLWFGLGSTQPLPGVPTSGTALNATSDQDTPDTISIHVSGAVVHPGVVDLPSGSRASSAVAAAGGARQDADLGRMNLAASVRDGEHIIVPSTSDRGEIGASVDTGVDVNVAGVSELQQLAGVGPVLAGRIVSFRDDNGPFATVEDLLDVPGIGEAKLQAMRDAIAPP
jgi:competence protein ComEA